MSAPKNDKKLFNLIQDVFGTPQGKELLDLLQELNKVVFDKNTNVMYNRTGRYELLQEIANLLQVTDAEFEAAYSIVEDYDDSLFND